MDRVSIIKLLFFVVVCSSCKHNFKKEIFKLVYKNDFNFEADSINIREKGDAFQGKYYGTSSDSGKFTYTYVVALSDSFKNKSLKANLDFYARYRGKNYGNSLVVTVQSGDSVVGYRRFCISDYAWFPNKWYNITDSTQFDIQNYSKGLILKVYGYNSFEKGAADYDQIKISVFRSE